MWFWIEIARFNAMPIDEHHDTAHVARGERIAALELLDCMDDALAGGMTRVRLDGQVGRQPVMTKARYQPFGLRSRRVCLEVAVCALENGRRAADPQK